MATLYYSSRPDSPVVWSSTIVAAALHTDKRWATLAFAQGIYLSLFHDIYDM